MLNDVKREFIAFMLECGVLRFGDFTTKSGRKTPYFINTGHYDDGDRLRRLGQFYADTIVAKLGDSFDLLYGPAYKGIPLAVATSIAMAERHGRSVPVAFNRKEAKDHGEGGALIGHPITDGQRILLIDDVVTAGTSVAESVEILTAKADIKLAGLIVSVDRQERGKGDDSALQEVSTRHSMPAISIASLDDILAYIDETRERGASLIDEDTYTRIHAYRQEYGVS